MKRKAHKKLLKAFQNEVNKVVSDFSDCSICAIYCKDEELTIMELDAFRISKELGITKSDFFNSYTHKNYETRSFAQ